MAFHGLFGRNVTSYADYRRESAPFTRSPLAVHVARRLGDAGIYDAYPLAVVLLCEMRLGCNSCEAPRMLRTDHEKNKAVDLWVRSHVFFCLNQPQELSQVPGLFYTHVLVSCHDCLGKIVLLTLWCH